VVTQGKERKKFPLLIGGGGSFAGTKKDARRTKNAKEMGEKETIRGMLLVSYAGEMLTSEGVRNEQKGGGRVN